MPPTLMNEDVRKRLRAWFRGRLPGAEEVRIEGLDRIEFGYSAEMLGMRIAWHAAGSEHHRDVVLRLRPPSPGLLEPYDLARQFTILRALEGTHVEHCGWRTPARFWGVRST
jgi:hypothetical protein